MNQEKKPLLERIEKVTLMLTIVSTISVLIIGTALNRVRSEIKQLEYFLSTSENIEENYVKSLFAYTGESQKTINYVLDLRPENQQEIIEFIDAIEELGGVQDLDMNLESSGGAIYEKKKIDTLEYRISFYGGTNELKNFLYEVEKLPYFIKVEDFSYTTPLLIKEDSRENISIGLQIYINQNGGTN